MVPPTLIPKKSILTILLLLGWPLMGHAEKVLNIAGAGPSAAVVKLFFDEFSKRPEGQGYRFVVPQSSIKHKGGIRHSDTHLFGRSGRPLSESEQGQNKDEIIIARVPLAFVAGSGVPIRSMTIGTLADIYSGRISNWKALGGPDQKIKLVGREATESALNVLQRDFSFFRQLEFDEILLRDHEIVDYIASPAGRFALSFGARSNFEDRYVIDVYGFSSGVSVGLVYDTANANHPLVDSIKAYASTPEWFHTVQFHNYLPPKGDD